MLERNKASYEKQSNFDFVTSSIKPLPKIFKRRQILTLRSEFQTPKINSPKYKKCTIDLSSTYSTNNSFFNSINTSSVSNKRSKQTLLKSDQVVSCGTQMADPDSKKLVRQTLMKLGEFNNSTKKKSRVHRLGALRKNVFNKKEVRGSENLELKYQKFVNIFPPRFSIPRQFYTNYKENKLADKFSEENIVKKQMRTISVFNRRYTNERPVKFIKMFRHSLGNEKEFENLKIRSRFNQVNANMTQYKIKNVQKKYELNYPFRRLLRNNNIGKTTKDANMKSWIFEKNYIDPLKTFTAENFEDAQVAQVEENREKTVEIGKKKITIIIRNPKISALLEKIE